MQNKINTIKNIETRREVTEICKRLQILHRELTRKEMNERIQALNLPLSIYLFIMGNYSELMSLTYSNPSPGWGGRNSIY